MDDGTKLESLSVELTADEKDTMGEIVALAQSIYVRAVVNTGEMAGVTTASRGGNAMELDATRVMHRREATLAFEAAASFFHAQAEWMVKLVQAQRAAAAAEVADEARAAAEKASAAAAAAAVTAVAAAAAAAAQHAALDPASAPERSSLVGVKDEVLR
jgi:hypothetical protein